MADKFTAGEAVMTFTGDDRAFQRTADNVEQSMKKVAGTAKDSGKDVEGFIVNVRQFTLLYQFSSGLKAMGDAAEKVATEMRLGKATTGDLIEKVAEGIPIIGRFVEAGRAIHEAITGEKAYTEVLKQQTEQQEKRINAVKSYTEALKELQRTADDLKKGLTTPRGVLFDIASIFTGGQRDIEDLPDKLAKQYKTQFDDIADAKKEAQKKLNEAIAKNTEFTPGIGPGGGGAVAVRSTDSADVAEARKSLKKLDDQEDALKAHIKTVKELKEETIRVTNVEDARNVVVDKGVKVFKEFGREVQAFAREAPKIHDVTRQAVEGAVTEFERFRQKMVDLRTDFSHGLIAEGLFKTTELKFKVDEAISIVQGFWEKVRPQAQTGLHFLDSIFGAPVERVKIGIEDIAKRTADLFGGKGKRGLPKPEEFRAQFVSLAGLGSKIQQGAGSLTAEEIGAKQLEAQRKIDKNTEATAKAAADLAKAWAKGTPFAAVVS